MNETSDVVYMWEDKGPSFTIMTKKQYIEAGETKLNEIRFYTKVNDDPTEAIKKESNDLVQDMRADDDISVPSGWRSQTSKILPCAENSQTSNTNRRPFLLVGK